MNVIGRFDQAERRSLFGFEREIVAKVAGLRCRVYEVGILYSGRTYDEGQRIRWTDGVRALWCIVKYSCARRPGP